MNQNQTMCRPHTAAGGTIRCDEHGETFPSGAVCSHKAEQLRQDALRYHAAGDRRSERAVLDLLHLNEQARRRAG